ncbi:MAG: hypothetical protein IJ637_01590 [Prevotella sp.]|nr:hypothetical protein [Prevotella sp.]
MTNILLIMLRAPRPSRISNMTAIVKPRWIRRGYDGLTFFGTIITNNPRDAEAFNQQHSALNNHEMIHLYQARSTHNSWLCFYARYIYFWLKASRYRRHMRNAGYLLNPFEMEAYAHMHDLSYLKGADVADEWRKFAAMPLAERKAYVRTHS